MLLPAQTRNMFNEGNETYKPKKWTVGVLGVLLALLETGKTRQAVDPRLFANDSKCTLERFYRTRCGRLIRLRR